MKNKEIRGIETTLEYLWQRCLSPALPVSFKLSGASKTILTSYLFLTKRLFFRCAFFLVTIAVI